MEWLSDYVVGVLKSPTWANPVAEFVDLRCDIFDGGENRHEHFVCHKQFQQLVGDLWEAHLVDVSMTSEQFEEFSRSGLSQDRELHRVLVEQLLCVDDFQTFQAMMTKQNADLYKEAITVDSKYDEHLLQADVDPDGWQLYDQQLFSDTVALQGEDVETLRRSEEAEIAYAIALSLHLEGEGAKDSEQETAVPAYTPISLQCKEAERAAERAPPRLPQVAGFISSPNTHVLPPMQGSPSADTGSSVPTAIGFVSAPLVPLLPKQTAPRCVRVEPLQVIPATAQETQKPIQVSHPCKGPTPAEALAAAKAAAAAKTSAAAGGVSDDERRLRAEHLRKQRDLLLSKRQAERERQLTEHQSKNNNVRVAVDSARQISQGNTVADRREGAPSHGAAIRETLTRQLRQTLSNS
mmetsp:Transcript_60093/g.159846  ORF Transcript_60093/g.159846 Transcript_60093/m.159846 type:complete len:408 (-) Transcript_60093:222-1445(-)|eukprot:CAMPEP_0194504242 /NCGR_PEP_ID=MMETSP0253-20130528/28839_1 /TAXON_ID=2966 /ORGANISM="Noctiluca scintillans" /LENGTH=407 /DNA_ID=CAMNT_0039346615 /DNA_START=139 /DNA_END=1362 /DNA_ORIENTATION=-